MALIITFTSGNTKEWCIGQELHLLTSEISTINNIQADGDEFYHIQDLFSVRNGQSKITIYSIPMLNYKRVMTWYGDIAKTIIANL